MLFSQIWVVMSPISIRPKTIQIQWLCCSWKMLGSCRIIQLMCNLLIYSFPNLTSKKFQSLFLNIKNSCNFLQLFCNWLQQTLLYLSLKLIFNWFPPYFNIIQQLDLLLPHQLLIPHSLLISSNLSQSPKQTTVIFDSVFFNVFLF